MIGAANFPTVSGAVSPISRKSLLRVENARHGNGLQDKAAAGDGRRESAAKPAPLKHSSRFETNSAPHWHVPRHSAAFIAQILGQMLAQGAPDALSACTAYADTIAGSQLGGRFDRSA